MLTTTRTAVILATSGCLLAGARADEDEDIMLDAEASGRELPNNDVALVALFTVGPILLLATCQAHLRIDVKMRPRGILARRR